MFVTTGRLEQLPRSLPFGNDPARKWNVIQSFVAGCLHRSIISREFRSPRMRDRFVSYEALPLFWMTKHREQSVSEQVGRRAMTGNQQQNEVHDRLLRAEPISCFLDGTDIAQHIVPRTPPTLFDRVPEIVDKGCDAVPRGAGLPG
ncbi:MAG TPA: hypothetical protein VGC09_09945 [Rhodopila sp.]